MTTPFPWNLYDPDDDSTKTPERGYGATPDTLCPACGQDNAPDGPGCACYGDPLPPYWPGVRPNADELAAFRRAIRPDLDDIHPEASPDMAAHHGIAAAWESERREGIGHPAAEHRQPVYVTDPADPRSLLVMSANDAARLRASLARREAAAMRSRAYLRAFGRVAADAADWRPAIATTADAATHRTFEPR